MSVRDRALQALHVHLHGGGAWLLRVLTPTKEQGVKLGRRASQSRDPSSSNSGIWPIRYSCASDGVVPLERHWFLMKLRERLSPGKARTASSPSRPGFAPFMSIPTMSVLPPAALHSAALPQMRDSSARHLVYGEQNCSIMAAKSRVVASLRAPFSPYTIFRFLTWHRATARHHVLMH